MPTRGASDSQPPLYACATACRVSRMFNSISRQTYLLIVDPDNMASTRQMNRPTDKTKMRNGCSLGDHGEISSPQSDRVSPTLEPAQEGHSPITSLLLAVLLTPLSVCGS